MESDRHEKLELKIVQNTSYEELRMFLSSSNACRTQDITKDFSAAFEKRIAEAISHDSKEHLLILLDVASLLLSQNQVPVVKTLISTNFMRSFELILDYLPSELSSKKVSRPRGDQVLVKFIDFILRIVDSTKVLYLWFTHKMLNPLVKIVATPTAYFKVRHECLNPLTEILSTVSKDVNAAVRQFVCQKELNFRRMSHDLMTNLTNIGDYRLQESVLELLFRIWSTTSRNEMALAWCNNNASLADRLRKISYSTFDYDSRQFLNAVNSASSRRKVLSLPYKELQVGHQVLRFTSDDFKWADFCYESKVLTILFPLEQTECLISSSHVLCFDSYENIQKNTVDIHLTFHKIVSELLTGFDQLHGNASSVLIIRLLKEAALSRRDVLHFATALFGPLQQSCDQSERRSKPIENFVLQRTETKTNTSSCSRSTLNRLDETHVTLSQNSCREAFFSQASSQQSIIKSSQRSGQFPVNPVLPLTQHARISVPSHGPISLTARPPSSFYSASSKSENYESKMMLNLASRAAKSRPVVPCLMSQTNRSAADNAQLLKSHSSLMNTSHQANMHKKVADHPETKKKTKPIKSTISVEPFLSQASASSEYLFKKAKPPSKAASAKKSGSRKQQLSLNEIAKVRADKAHTVKVTQGRSERGKEAVKNSSAAEVPVQVPEAKRPPCEKITEVIPETQHSGHDNKDPEGAEVNRIINELLYDAPRRITRALSQSIEQGIKGENTDAADKKCSQNKEDTAIEDTGHEKKVDRVGKRKKGQMKSAAKVKAQFECLKNDSQDKKNIELAVKKPGAHIHGKGRLNAADKMLPKKKKKRSLLSTDVIEPIEDVSVYDPEPAKLKERTYTKKKSHPESIVDSCFLLKSKHSYGVAYKENEQKQENLDSGSVQDIPSPTPSPEQLRFEEPETSSLSRSDIPGSKKETDQSPDNDDFGIGKLKSLSELCNLTFDDIVLSLETIEASDLTKNETALDQAFGEDVRADDNITSQLTHIQSLEMPKFIEFDTSIPKKLESEMSQISELAWQNNRTPTEHGTNEILEKVAKKPKKRKIMEESLLVKKSKKKNTDIEKQGFVEIEGVETAHNLEKDELQRHHPVFALIQQYVKNYSEKSDENSFKRNEELRDLTRKITLRTKFHTRAMEELDGYLEETEKFVESQTRKIDSLLKKSAKNLIRSKEEDNRFQHRLRSTNDDTAKSMRKLSLMVSEELRKLVDASNW